MQTKRSGASILVHNLERAGITDAFGMAGHTNIALLDALLDSSIAFHSVHHEQVAAHAADAYFRVSRRPAALIVHVGPGVTNALTGLGDAAADGSAVVVVAGDVASFHQGKDAFQEIALHNDAAQWEVARPLTKRCWKVTSVDSLEPSICAALRKAQGGRPGPVLLSIAMDVFSRTAAGSSAKQPTLAHAVMGTATLQSLHEAASLLHNAMRPVILAGGGALDATEELAELIELTQGPFVTTLSGRTSVDELHHQCLGAIGRTGSPAANRAIAEADVLLAVGTQFPEQDSSSWTPGKTFNIPPTRLIHIDVDVGQIGKVFPVEVGVVADARAVLADLVTILRGKSASSFQNARHQWLDALCEEHGDWRRRNVDDVPKGERGRVHPGFVLHQISSTLPDEAIVLGDVGWGKNGTSQFLRRRLPRTMLLASGFGTMGWSAAGALGAKAARPEVPVVSITGDGGMSSCLSSLITASEHGRAVVWVVLNNGVYQSIMGLQRQHFSRTIGTVFAERGPTPRTDFATIARGCGVEARSVCDPADVSDAVQWALSIDRPVLLDVYTDPDAFPPAGGYWDVHEVYRMEQDCPTAE